MPLIVETIVTTMSATGEVHVAPLGLIADGDQLGRRAVQALAHARKSARGPLRGGEPYR